MILEDTWSTSWENLEVKVISGHQLPTSKRDMIDPYIVIEVLSPNETTKRGPFETSKEIKVCIKVHVHTWLYIVVHRLCNIVNVKIRIPVDHRLWWQKSFLLRIMGLILISMNLSKLVELIYQKFLFLKFEFVTKTGDWWVNASQWWPWMKTVSYILNDAELAFYIQLPSHIYLYTSWKGDTVQLSCMINMAKSLKWQLYSCISNFEFQCGHPMSKKKFLPINWFILNM